MCEDREFFPVSFKGTDGCEKTATLNELAPTTIGEKVASYFSISQRAEIAAVQQALDQHYNDLLQDRDTLQQLVEAAGELAESYREKVQSWNRATLLPQFAAQEVVGIQNFAAQQTVANSPFEVMTVSPTNGVGIASITNPAQQAEQGIDLGMPHLQSTRDDQLEQARQKFDKVSAESVAANETGMGAGLAADTEVAGSESLAALL